ncbi:hypothetical protein I3W98_40200, partial [Streptomyces cavourensis]|nr:hypothetical protein [Streptomyces cavourensis]
SSPPLAQARIAELGLKDEQPLALHPGLRDAPGPRPLALRIGSRPLRTRPGTLRTFARRSRSPPPLTLPTGPDPGPSPRH